MKEELITFETAKLAKEKGFDISAYKLRACYSSDGSYVIDGELKQGIIGELINPDIVYQEKHITAPTQSLLQKWLRDIHNIGVFVTKPPSYLVEYEAQIVKLPVGHSLVNVWQDNSEIKGSYYEEALEKGLQEALKLIS